MISFTIKAAPVILLFLISGCAVDSSNSSMTDMELPKEYNGLHYESREGDAVYSGQWWRAFNDARLNSLMDKAFAGNLNLLVALERVKQAHATADATGAALSPALNLTASAGRTNQSSFTNNNSYSLSAAASYEVDLWKKLGAGSEGARLDALASREDMKALYITLSADIAELYFVAMEERAQIDLTEENITAFAETASRLEERYRAGLVGPLDVYRSRENLSAARARLPLFQERLEKTEHALSVLIGEMPGKEKGWQFSGRAYLPEPPGFPAGLPSDLLKRRPDIEAATLRLASSDKALQAAIADRFPSFNLVGDYGGSSTNLKSVLESPNIFWNLAVQAVLPLLDGGRRKALSARAESKRDEELLRYRSVVLNSLKEVEDALSSDTSSEERIKRLTERTRAGRAALDLAKDRYFHGLDNYLPVLDGQRRYFDSVSELTGARRARISATIALARAIGGDWTEGFLKAPEKEGIAE